MTAMADVLANVTVGPAVSFQNLMLFPLLSEPEESLPDYITLNEALAKGEARITEVTEGGSVPELLLENLAKQKLLGVDGEELVVAKQNRILNLSILLAPESRTVIPVSCVERGRWAWRSRHFSSSGHNIYAAARAGKMAHVSESMRRDGGRRSDQSALWMDIDCKFSRMNVKSSSDAMSDAYDAHAVPLSDYVKAFTPQPTQVGAIFAVDGRVAGVELFDAPSTLAKFLSKLVESYALDAIETVSANKQTLTEAGGTDEILKRVGSSQWQTFPGVGLGQDLRIDEEDFTAGALVVDGKLVHLAAFMKPKEKAQPAPQ